MLWETATIQTRLVNFNRNQIYRQQWNRSMHQTTTSSRCLKVRAQCNILTRFLFTPEDFYHLSEVFTRDAPCISEKDENRSKSTKVTPTFHGEPLLGALRLSSRRGRPHLLCCAIVLEASAVREQCRPPLSLIHPSMTRQLLVQKAQPANTSTWVKNALN